MSVQASSWVIEHSRHGGSELLLLLMIANHAHADGTGAFPSLSTLARECRLSRRQVVRLITRLEASGELVIDRRGDQQTNYYTIVMVEGGDKMSLPDEGGGDKMSLPSDIAMSPEPSFNKEEDNNLLTEDHYEAKEGYAKEKLLEEEVPRLSSFQQPLPTQPPLPLPKPKTSKSKKPVDERKDHPALIAIRSVTARYPDKVLWDTFISILGETPDIELLERCYLGWRAKGRNPVNYSWITEWYANGSPFDSNVRPLRSDKKTSALDIDSPDWKPEYSFKNFIHINVDIFHKPPTRSTFEWCKQEWLRMYPESLPEIEDYERSSDYRDRFKEN